VTAEIGSPPPSAFAVQIRSGTMPSWSLANMSPVRARPDCTSSATKTMPCSWQNSATRLRKPAAGTMKPQWLALRLAGRC